MAQPSAFGAGTTGGFGAGTTNAFSGPGGSAFGANTGTTAFGQNKPAFGAGLGGGGAFGQNTNTTTPAFGATGSTFGTTPSTGAFGANTSTPQTGTGWQGFGANTQNTGATGGFGGAQQENKPVFGGFGANNPAVNPATVTGVVGGFGAKPPGTTGAFGGFGTGGTGTFGQTPSTGTIGLFGGNTGATPGSAGTGLGGFGASNTGATGAFGGTATGLFNKPATTTSPFGLGGTGLGSGTAGTSGTFGTGTSGFGTGISGFGLGTQNQPPAFGASTTGTAGGTGFFGTQQSQSQTTSSVQQQQTSPLQQLLSTPYGTNPLFQYGSASAFAGDATKPIAPIATLLPKDAAKDEKNPAIIAGFRLTPSGSSKSRFSLGSSSPLSGSPFNRSKRDVLGLGLTPTKLGTPTSSTSSNFELTPDAFVVPRKGLKNLEISRTKRDLGITGGEVKSIEGGDGDGIGGARGSSTVDPGLEKEARERERQAATDKITAGNKKIEGSKQPSSTAAATNGPITLPREPATAKENLPAGEKKNTPTASAASSTTAGENPDISTQEDGSYWTIPSMHAILSARDVRAIPNFVVGRKGYGQVRFLSPVDLGGVRSIPDIPGQTVIFDRKICTVYPDESTKPPVGKGLNVPAVITLEQCWPVSKETRAPILDVENPRFVAHVERLKRQPDTEFLDYIADSGSWVFKVSHF
jgi:nuclear pore complex protein Nup98-Nup96